MEEKDYVEQKDPLINNALGEMDQDNVPDSSTNIIVKEGGNVIVQQGTSTQGDTNNYLGEYSGEVERLRKELKAAQELIHLQAEEIKIQKELISSLRESNFNGQK